jgi:uncharacterized protein
MDLDRNGLEILDRAECLSLLRDQPVGRMVFTERAMPTVRPVNFHLDGDRILVRTGEGGKLNAALHDAVVAFEVDDFDAAFANGWSVIVTGRARVVEPGAIDVLPSLTRWAPLGNGQVVAIDVELVTGRRLPSRNLP